MSALEDLSLANQGDERFRIDMEALDSKTLTLFPKNPSEDLKSIPSAPPVAAETQTFHHPPQWRVLEPEQLFTLGMLLLDNCPDDDCIIFRNTFKMCREMDNQLDGLTGQDLQKLKSRFYREYESLEHMYQTNFAVRRYLQEHPLEVAYNIKRGGQA